MKNKNIPSQGNKQEHQPREGQQQKVAGTSGNNTVKSRENVGNRSETDSDRTNRNEERGIRGGKSSY